jgi:hypothetical protein
VFSTMIHCEFPKSLPKVCARLGAEKSTFQTEALEGHDAFIVERNTSEVIG